MVRMPLLSLNARYVPLMCTLCPSVIIDATQRALPVSASARATNLGHMVSHSLGLLARITQM